jgi:hypothetical protein
MAKTPSEPELLLTPRAAKGRTLAEFLPLRRAEQKLLDACRVGEQARYNLDIEQGVRPDDVEERLRSEFVRFICLGGDQDAPINKFCQELESRINITSGWIEPAQENGLGLDLSDAELPYNISILRTHIAGRVVLSRARGKGINFAGCSVNEIFAERLILTKDLSLRDDFKCKTVIWLSGAQIGGDINCENGKFGRPGSMSIDLDDAVINGSVFFTNGFKTEGLVSLQRARIGGNLDCSNGQFESVFDKALNCDGANIKGSLILSSERELSFPKLSIRGGVNLENAHVGALIDDAEALQQGGPLVLDGFRYDSIGRSEPNVVERIIWLRRQPKDNLKGNGFRPRPWVQLIGVLRRMGHGAEADEVAIAFQDQRRAAGKVKTWLGRKLHQVFGLLVGYGYKPLRLLKTMFWVWLICGGIYWAAAMNGGFGPSNPLVFDAKRYDHCRPARLEAEYKPRNKQTTVGNWYWCKELAGEYTTFQPWLYSLDLILPLVELQQDKDWAPIIPTPLEYNKQKSVVGNVVEHALSVPDITLMQPMPPDGGRVPWFNWTAGQFARVVMWFEILFGWVASLLMVAVLTGLTNREKRDES